jgi:hypothetical protein
MILSVWRRVISCRGATVQIVTLSVRRQLIFFAVNITVLAIYG